MPDSINEIVKHIDESVNRTAALMLEREMALDAAIAAGKEAGIAAEGFEKKVSEMLGAEQ